MIVMGIVMTVSILINILLRHTRDVVEEVDQYMAIYEVVEEGDKPEVEEEEQEEQEIDE